MKLWTKSTLNPGGILWNTARSDILIEGEPSMYEIAIWMITVPLCIVIVPNIVVELDKLCSRLDELIERRKRRRELMIEYQNGMTKL